jgi:hypothetical protein
MSVAIQALGTFRFFFPEDEWTGSFNCFEVQRSRFGDAGPWEDLHNPSGSVSAGFIILPKTAYDVDGLELELVVDRVHEVTVTFSGTSAADVAAAFNNAMPSVITSASLSTGVTVATLSIGHGASILVLADDAFTKLGIPGLFHHGVSSCPALLEGQEGYTFIDPAAEEDWYYRTRYLHRTSGEASTWSVPVPAAINVVVDPSELIKGEVYVTDPSGRPVQNVLVLLGVQADSTNPGMLPVQLQQYTDSNGYAGVLVRKGVKAVVSLSGTGVSREIQVPSTGDTFDLMDVSLSTQPDAFRVQVPNIKVGERRSM